MLSTQDIPEVICSAVLFIFLWQYMGRRLFAPYFAMLEEREAKTAGSVALAAQKRQETRRLSAELKQSLQDFHLQGLQKRDELVSRAKADAQAIAEEADFRAAEVVAAGKEEASKLRARAVAELEGEVEKVSSLMMSRVLEGGSDRVVH